MVKKNVVFNQDDTNTLEDTAIIYDKVMSEGEKEKIIQNLQNNVKDVKKSVNEESEDQETSINRSEPHQRPKSPIDIPLPQSNDEAKSNPEPQDDNQSSTQKYRCGQHARPKRGHYKAINEGLIAAITVIVEDPPEANKDLV